MGKASSGRRVPAHHTAPHVRCRRCLRVLYRVGAGHGRGRAQRQGLPHLQRQHLPLPRRPDRIHGLQPSALWGRRQQDADAAGGQGRGLHPGQRRVSLGYLWRAGRHRGQRGHAEQAHAIRGFKRAAELHVPEGCAESGLRARLGLPHPLQLRGQGRRQEGRHAAQGHCGRVRRLLEPVRTLGAQLCRSADAQRHPGCCTERES
mmetsp:Transcript_20715/g.46750  ORF Transcript_20715/g.46750 Transcript_20715/m.46750 type:complete len:204 (-) Transcript_20715:522-1133(-)